MGIVGVEQAKAYGSAGDLPGLLRAMESTDPDVREEAMQWLGSATYHDDGLALSITGAVPRLARLVLGGPGHRVDLLRLLAGLARRSDWPDAAQPARRAVADALPPLLPLAHDADTDVRDATVLLIGASGRRDTLPLLWTRLERETDPLVRAHLVTALGLLEPGDGAWRHGLLTDPEPRVALAAAEDLLRTAGVPLPAPLVDRCARAFTADPHEPDGTLWPAPHTVFTERLLDDAEAALRALAGGVPIAYEITGRWRDREADVLPWALAETGAHENWGLDQLAQLTCALPVALHARVRDHVLPQLASGDPRIRAAAVAVLARARAPRAVEEAVRLVEELPGRYDTARAARAVADEFGAAAVPVARAVARRLRDGHPHLVEVLARFPEPAVAAVDDLVALLARTGTGYPPVVVALFDRLGPAAAGDAAERALMACVTERAHSSVSAVAGVAYHRVTGDPGPALSFFREEMTAFHPSLTMEWASRLGPAAAPLLPFIEPSLTRDGTASAALAVWRITGRTEDTLEPLAREAMRWQRIYDGLTHPVSTLTEMGLLPRFAVEPLRRGAASRRRVVHDFMTGPEPHADDVSRTAVRRLLDTARIVD
ncbi:HEAT repeat domain-containing protein [Streptomyces sp. NPDC006259]|uniref:HEAT repeat domain-containing protein n=1 Tax=Streptomyces sp. NPDC006259 TaxID=3364740 RepID=UPI00367658C7